RCADAIDWVAVPPAHYRAVLDAVALTRGGAPAADWDPRSYAGRSGLLFAKSGLLVRPGAPAELVVPPGSPLRIGWGHGAEPTTRLRLPACTADAGEGGWLAFAGGVWVREPGCYELAVRVGDREELVRIGVFAACPAASAP
ncbi:MAG: hypothetical protein HY908_04265, partial [Myxococcales bacterium]|nr:hypothetical protein [Myxococcales bacterium]